MVRVVNNYLKEFLLLCKTNKMKISMDLCRTKDLIGELEKFVSCFRQEFRFIFSECECPWKSEGMLQTNLGPTGVFSTLP